METGQRQTDTNAVTISLVYTVANLFLVPNSFQFSLRHLF